MYGTAATRPVRKSPTYQAQRHAVYLVCWNMRLTEHSIPIGKTMPTINAMLLVADYNTMDGGRRRIFE